MNEKLANFWKYYKWHILLWIVGAVLLVGYLVRRADNQSVVLYGIFLNTEKGENSTSELIKDFGKEQDINLNVYKLKLEGKYVYNPKNESGDSGNYKSSQAILAGQQEKKLDFVAGNEEAMLDIAYNAIYADLTSFFTKKEQKQYEPYFLYVDNVVIGELEQAAKEKKDTSKIQYPDPRKPEEMKEPIPVLLDLSKCEAMKSIYGEKASEAVLGVMGEAPNKERLKEFLKFISVGGSESDDKAATENVSQ